MTIVVTGATGHLGHLAVEALLREGVAPGEILATGRALEKLDDLAARGVRVARVDYNEPETVASSLDGADRVLLVSSSEVGKRFDQHRVVIDAAQQAGVRHLVYTSAPQATTSALILAPEHKATEEYLHTAGVPFTILRNNWYNENYLQSAAQAVATGTLAASVGEGRVASAARADYADAAVAVLLGEGHEGRTYELSGDVAWSHEELAAILADVAGTPVTYVSLSPEEHLAALTAAGLDEGTAGFVVGLDANIRDGLLAERSGELATLIGRPTTSIRETLAAAL